MNASTSAPSSASIEEAWGKRSASCSTTFSNWECTSCGDGCILYQLEVTANDDDRALVLQALNRKAYGEYWAIPILWRHDTYAMNPALAGWQPTNGTSSDLHFETIRPAQ